MKAFVIICLATLVACAHAAPKGTEKTVEPPLQRSYPALAWVPADATYVVTGRVADVARTLRETIAPLAMFPVPGPGEIEAALRSLTGLNPLSDRELAAAGIAVDGSGVMFSTGVWPTFAVRIEDPAALTAHLEKYWPRSGVRMREQDGVEVVDWDAAPGLVLSYARVDDWLLLHADAPGDASAGAWLDSARATFAAQGIAAQEDMIRAADRARERLAERGADVVPDMIGLARVGPLLEAAGAAGCATSLASGIRSVEIAADVSLRSGEGVIAVELTPNASGALLAGTAAPPSAGYRAYRASAGLYADLGIDLGWLDAGLAYARCPAVGPRFGDITRVLAAFDARTVHVAIRQLLLDERKVQAAAHVGLHSRAAIERQVLDSIPGRSLLERKATIAGQVVRVIDLGVFPRIGYQLNDDHGVVAIGAESIDEVYGGAGDPSGGRLLAAMGVRPERMPDLESALAVILEQMGYAASSAPRFINQVLSRYADAGFALTLVGDTIELRGWYELAP